MASKATSLLMVFQSVFRCGRIAPFCVPVVPEVNMMICGSSSAGGESTAGSVASKAPIKSSYQRSPASFGSSIEK